MNSLLQGPYFTATDLATIGKQLDEEEEEAIGMKLQESSNFDDTGFFSLQIIQRALQVWNLQTIPIASTDPVAVKAKNDPEKEDAFILNLAEHWFALRRFGKSNQRWYNLNSTASEPEHVSELHLGLLLQQMQNDGYSVFVILGDLPDSPADQNAQIQPIPPPEALVKKRKLSNSEDDFKRAIAMSLGKDGVDDEATDDSELAMALKASLAETDNDNSLAMAISMSLKDHGNASSSNDQKQLLSPEELRRKRLERFK